MIAIVIDKKTETRPKTTRQDPSVDKMTRNAKEEEEE